MWDVGGAVEGEGRYQEGWGGGGVSAATSVVNPGFLFPCRRWTRRLGAAWGRPRPRL